MYEIKKSEATASLRRIPFRLISSTDGITPMASQTSITVTISKVGGSPSSSGGSVTEIGNGDYYYTATTGEVDTYGFLRMYVTKSGCRDFSAMIWVTERNPYTASQDIVIAKGTNVTGFNDITSLSVWDVLTATIITANSVGKRIIDNIDAKISDVQAQTDLISSDPLTQTYYLSTLEPLIAGIKTSTTEALGEYDAATNAVINALNNLSAAQVKAQADAALSDIGATSSRMLYLDNLNVGGAVASHADILAINASASKHLLIQTVGQYERPESGTTTYTVEVRTFNATTGAAVNADSTPTLTATGQTTGSLAANVGAGSNPATGVYRYAYSVASTATVEPIRMDVSAAIASSTFTLSCYTQVVDLVSATWTSTNNTQLTAIYNKLPSNNIADQTLLVAAVGSPMQAGTQVTLADASLTTAKLGTFALAKGTHITGFTDVTAAQTATAVWQDLLSGSDFTTVGSVGKLLATNVDAQISTMGGLDATAMRAAIGLATANLDTQFSSIPAALLASPSNKIATGTGGTVSLSAVDGISDAVFRQVLLSYIAGHSTVVDNGGGSKTITYKRQDGTTASLAITFNSSGEWTATTITP